MKTITLNLLAVAVLLGCGPADAADRQWSVAGQSLKIDTPCAKTITIEPDASLKDHVVVAANAKYEQEIERLTVSGGAVAAIAKHADRCYTGPAAVEVGPVNIGMSNMPTLTMLIKVPAAIAIAIEDHGSGDYRIGAVGGTLAYSLGGSGGLQAANARDLHFALSGSGDSKIDEVTGSVRGKVSGSGDMMIAHVTASSSEFALAGSGHVKLVEGNAGTVSVSQQGSSGISLPIINGLQISISGSGDASVHQLDGPLGAQVSGSGRLSIGQVHAAKVDLSILGSGEIRLGTGDISKLALSSSGSGEVGVDAVVGDASIQLMGSSDVHLAQVTGKLAKSSLGSGHVSVGGH